MNALKSLTNLLLKLENDEINSLIHHLKSFRHVANGGDLKSIQLVKHILKKKQASYDEICILLYGYSNRKTLNRLIYRLKSKIYEVILFDNNLSKSIYSKKNRIVFDLRKRLAQSEILYLRGMNDDLVNILDKIILRAKKYEIYDILIVALRVKQRFKSFRFGIREFERIEKDIKYFEYNQSAANNARSSFEGIIAKVNQSTSARDYIDELKKILEVLKIDFSKTSSSIVGFYYYFLKTEWLFYTNEYHKAETVLRKLLKLVEDNVSVHTESRLGDVFINLANNAIYLNNFESAIIDILNAKKHYLKNSINYGIANEVEFYIRFYKGEINTAEKIINNLYNTTRSTNTPYLFSRRAYLFACVKTMKDDYNESNRLLNEVNEISKDKEGWNIGKRVLTILNRIEAGDLDSADLKVMSLEKFIQRIRKFRHVRKRDITILKILRSLITEGFDFKKVYEKRKRYFDLLESNNEEYRWQIKSPELIVFHKWFVAKMNGLPYRFSL